MPDFMTKKRDEENEKTGRIHKLANKFADEEMFARGRSRYEILCEVFRVMIDEGDI